MIQTELDSTQSYYNNVTTDAIYYIKEVSKNLTPGFYVFVNILNLQDQTDRPITSISLQKKTLLGK